MVGRATHRATNLIAAVAAVVPIALGSPAAQDRMPVPPDDLTRPATTEDVSRDVGTEPNAERPGARQASAGSIPLLQFEAPAAWVKVEIIDNVTGGCFLGSAEAQEHAIRSIRALGQQTEGDEGVFHVIFRVRATGDRMQDGSCFGAIFFEELYPVAVAVRPGAEPYRSRWPGRLGLQKLVIDEDAFDREVLQVIDDGIRILFRER